MPGAPGPLAAGPPAPAATKRAPAGEPAPDHAAVKPEYQDGPPEPGTPSWFIPRWIFTKGLLLAGIFLAIAYAAHLLVAEIRKPDSAVDEQTAHASGGPIVHDAPAQQASVLPTAADTGSQSATTKPQVMSSFTDISDNPRDQRRDSALRIAEQCASEHVWGCVRQKASEALAIDSNSQRARALMERVILATGWKPLSPPNPPGAPNANAMASAATPSAAAHAASPASNKNNNSVDTQQRAIVQDGWKRSAPANGAH
ncbi:hypothetical protein PWP93_25770 [Paraburkholderia sp. A1RI-2L]|uniref:hypothetical protein n=1 Tax=Paraburkholderia sp. A1RI-2L TaxID=3028367 RepID=UPI003B7CC6C9